MTPPSLVTAITLEGSSIVKSVSADSVNTRILSSCLGRARCGAQITNARYLPFSLRTGLPIPEDFALNWRITLPSVVSNSMGAAGHGTPGTRAAGSFGSHWHTRSLPLGWPTRTAPEISRSVVE